MEKKPYHHKNLKNDLIEKGIELVNKNGINQLSLRKVAQACGVSHAAPYCSSFGSCLVFVWIENFLKADLFRLFCIVIRNLDFFSKKLDFFGEVVYNIGITLLRKELDYEINTYKNCCAFIGSCDGDYSWRLQ